MLPALLLLAADPETAIEAERAFARQAQTEGQWAAFRATSTEDAIWFLPQPAKVHETLPDKEPPIAVQWWPAESYVSCDGTVAVNTGPWVRPRANGYFTTVWVRQPDGHFKWVLDHGDAMATPRPLPEIPRVRRASCASVAGDAPAMTQDTTDQAGGGASADFTLTWQWQVRPDGSRSFTAELWNGRAFDTVVENQIAAPPAK